MVDHLSIPEALTLGLQTMGLGLLVTFVALFALIIIITLFSIIMRDRKKAKKPTQEPIKPNAQKPSAVAAQTITPMPWDSELAAVFAAAIAAYIDAERPTGRLVVRSYRKIPSAWARAGRDAQIYNKF